MIAARGLIRIGPMFIIAFLFFPQYNVSIEGDIKMKKYSSKLIWACLALVFVSACILSLSWYRKETPLRLAMSAETSPLFSSEVVGLTLTAENSGSKAVSDITAAIVLPEGLSLRTSSPAAERTFAVLQPGQSASLTVYLAQDGGPATVSEPEPSQDDSQRTIHDGARSLRAFAVVLLLISIAGYAGFAFITKKDHVRAGILLGAVLLTGLLIPFLLSKAGSGSEESVQAECLLYKGTDDTAYSILARASYRVAESGAEDPYTEYRVVFDMEDAPEQAALSVRPGTLLTENDLPRREGFAFAGWFLDPEHTRLFDFRQEPVDGDMILYTHWVEAGRGWDSDKDGISDDEERAVGSDPFGAEDTAADRDGDGLPDYWESCVYHSDPDTRDTDGDGLTDWFEAMRSDTDPAQKDTNGEGRTDDLRDADKDGLTNKEEQEAGTDPRRADTDGDGLSDGDELTKAGTDPQKRDSDGDGAGDGWEHANGYDPQIKDEHFEVQVSKKAAGGLTASVKLKYKGDPESVRITETQIDQLLDAGIPGYIGGIFDFSAAAPIDTADVLFTFDPLTVPKGADLCIYHYNPDTMLLEAVPTRVNNGRAAAQVKQLSVYALLDRKALEEVRSEAIMNLNSDLYRTSVFDVAFVIDYSSSMNDNDPDSLRLKIVRSFIEKLRDNQDQATVIQFAAKATTLVPLSSNKKALLNAVDNITNASGEGCNDKDVGTNGSDGIHAALEELKDLEHGFKYIIFLTDGEDTSVSYDYESLVKEAKKNNVTIFSIGMGDANRELLQHIAEATGGKYYFADSVDMDDTSKGSLMYVFHDIEISTIDLETDSNNDGISDYHTRMICEGRLRTGTGTRLFEGVSFEELQAGDDFDRDGIKNGEEVHVAFDVASQRTYLSMLSSPTKTDSDGDGIPDASDPAPLFLGLTGGICGDLSLVTVYHEEDSGWTFGRVFFLYTSRVRQDLDLSAMAAGWSRKDGKEPWSSENLQRDETPQKAYHLEPGDVLTFGLGMTGDSAIRGPVYNLEISRYCQGEQGADCLHNVFLTMEVSPEDLQTVLEDLTQAGDPYWDNIHSSVEAACSAWNRLGAISVSAYDPDFAGGRIPTPRGLRNNLRKLTGAKEDLVLKDVLK